MALFSCTLLLLTVPLFAFVTLTNGADNRSHNAAAAFTARLVDQRHDEIQALGRSIRQSPGAYGPPTYSSPSSNYGYPSGGAPPAYTAPSQPSYGSSNSYAAPPAAPPTYQQPPSSNYGSSAAAPTPYYSAAPSASGYSNMSLTPPVSPSTSVKIVYTPVVSLQFGSKYYGQLLSPNNVDSPLTWDNFTFTRPGAAAPETIFINNTQLLLLPSSFTFRTIPHALTAPMTPVGWLDNDEVTMYNKVPIVPLIHGRTRISATISGSQSLPTIIPFLNSFNRYDDIRLGATQFCVGTPNCMWICFQLTSKSLWVTYISGRDTLLLAVPRANAAVNARAYAVQTARIAASSPAQKHYVMVEYNSKDNVFIVFVNGQYVLTVPMPGLKLVNNQFQLIMERMGTPEALCTPAELFFVAGITSRLDASDPNMQSSTTGLVDLVGPNFVSAEGFCGDAITDVNGNVGTSPFYLFPTSFEQPTSPRWARLFGQGNTMSIYNLQVATGEERDVYYAPPAAPPTSYAAAPAAYSQPSPPMYSAPPPPPPPPPPSYSTGGSYGNQPPQQYGASSYNYQGPSPPVGGPTSGGPPPMAGASSSVPGSSNTWW